jgi:putative cobalt transporter subunit CbtA
MEKRVIARGLVAGGLGGVLAFLFAGVFVEPAIGRAIDFEDAHMQAAHEQGVHEHGAQLFTRGVQANIGMGFGILAFAIAMGALFAVVFAVAYGRIGSVGPRALSLLIAAGAFGAVYLVPFLKYPPNPPAVGRAETIGDRTTWYLVMLLASAVLAVAAVWLGRRLTARFGAWIAALVGLGAYIAAIAVVMLVLPTVAETPEHFPADVLYDFRLYSLGTQLVLWATIGLVFAPLVARLVGEQARATVAA